jgi:hypothetical protein
MQPAETTTSPPQQRLRRFVRQPELLASRQVTDKGLEAIATIERYRFIPSSLLVRLMPGGQRNNHRHLQTLFHKGLISRFAFPKFGGPGEFIYYLDKAEALNLLVDSGQLRLTDEDRQQKLQLIWNHAEKNYAGIHHNAGDQGKLLFLNHELMISRFHAMLELACRKFAGQGGAGSMETGRRAVEPHRAAQDQAGRARPVDGDGRNRSAAPPA